MPLETSVSCSWTPETVPERKGAQPLKGGKVCVWLFFLLILRTLGWVFRTRGPWQRLMNFTLQRGTPGLMPCLDLTFLGNVLFTLRVKMPILLGGLCTVKPPQ